jgi:hypothetical protein
MEDHYIPVAILNNKVLGYVWVQDYGPHIRLGHRKARLNDLWCEKRNVKWLEWQSSESALAFYEKLGFKGERCPDPEHPFFEIEYETKIE